MVILQGAEINVFRFPLQMLIRMPSTRVCRSWWWRGRRRWQPDQWRLRWRCGEGISESWWWALNEPSNSSSRWLCIGWKEKVVLLVLVSTPYLHKRIFFQSSICLSFSVWRITCHDHKCSFPISLGSVTCIAVGSYLHQRNSGLHEL
jgi:hypothetical protein